MAAADPAVRTAAARIAALTRWSREDGTAGLAPARRGLRRKFEQQVDDQSPGLSAAEREKRVGRLVSAHMSRLALKSAAKRRARAA